MAVNVPLLAVSALVGATLLIVGLDGQAPKAPATGRECWPFKRSTAMLSTTYSMRSGQTQIIADLGKMIVENCPPMLCTGLDCALVTERNGCSLCACPIGSPARGCDPMPFILWHDLIVNGCPNVTVNTRDPAQKVVG